MYSKNVLMYKNIGNKIKSLAAGTFLVEAIGSIITGFILMAEEDVLYILLVIFGPLVAWVSSWILYAFGELVEDVELIRKHFIPDETITQTNDSNNKTKTTNSQKKPTCDFCGKSHDKLNIYISKSTLGSGETEFQLCEKCAKEHGFI